MVHERLHGHAGFAAIQDGCITPGAYRALLLRLYGFHVAFERAARLPADRSRWLAQGIEHLSPRASDPASLPKCTLSLCLSGEARLLGGMCVIAGSALGGLGMYKRLDHVCGSGVIDGRRFLHGHGSSTGEAFGLLLARIEAAGNVPASRATMIDAALATFTAFEDWLAGWKDGAHV